MPDHSHSPVRAMCTVPDCDRVVYARKMCERHYRQIMRRGAVSPERPAPVACAVESCERLAVTRGWCHAHYLRLVRTGTVRPNDELRPTERPRCSLPACDEPHAGHGYCKSHLNRVRRFGDAQPHIPFQPTGAGGWLSQGYRYVPVPPELRHLSGGAIKLGEHRLVMAIVLDRPLETDEVVHHRNGDRTDNRPVNLELWNTGQPKGQRVQDKLDWARDLIERYEAHL